MQQHLSILALTAGVTHAAHTIVYSPTGGGSTTSTTSGVMAGAVVAVGGGGNGYNTGGCGGSMCNPQPYGGGGGCNNGWGGGGYSCNNGWGGGGGYPCNGCGMQPMPPPMLPPPPPPPMPPMPPPMPPYPPNSGCSRYTDCTKCTNALSDGQSTEVYYGGGGGGYNPYNPYGGGGYNPRPTTGCVWSNGLCQQTCVPGAPCTSKPSSCQDTNPFVCCLAMTATCLACQQGLTTAEYCRLYPGTSGCVNQGLQCGQAWQTCPAGYYCQMTPGTNMGTCLQGGLVMQCELKYSCNTCTAQSGCLWNGNSCSNYCTGSNCINVPSRCAGSSCGMGVPCPIGQTCQYYGYGVTQTMGTCVANGGGSARCGISTTCGPCTSSGCVWVNQGGFGGGYCSDSANLCTNYGNICTYTPARCDVPSSQCGLLTTQGCTACASDPNCNWSINQCVPRGSCAPGAACISSPNVCPGGGSNMCSESSCAYNQICNFVSGRCENFDVQPRYEVARGGQCDPGTIPYNNGYCCCQSAQYAQCFACQESANYQSGIPPMSYQEACRMNQNLLNCRQNNLNLGFREADDEGSATPVFLRGVVGDEE